MPGHFTHIYTARRVAEYLSHGQFPDWPAIGDVLRRHTAQECGQVMTQWEKFTALGAIGPDLFYFLQDYNNETLGPLSDELMLGFASYYFYDSASEDDWEPLLVILAEVNSTLAALLRFLIKLQKAWQSFVDGWNATVGPLVSAISEIPDDLTGGLLSEFGTVLDEFKTALINIVEEELTTGPVHTGPGHTDYADIFGLFDTCVQKGFSEKLFLWSDMSHYRRPSALARALVEEAENLRDGTNTGGDRYQQFLAFALGYITHIGTDTVAHSFVNEQCGGPYRNHPQRHHLIENHIDAWVYSHSGPGGELPTDPWGRTDTYPDLTMSAMWFAVQLTPGAKDAQGKPQEQGQQRPHPLPDDPDQRKKALDKDGELPDWMAESIVKAMIAAFRDHDHPLILQGDAFQNSIDNGMLTKWVETITGHGLDQPFDDLLKAIAPKPSFKVPVGFPLPWQIKTVYKIMYTFYRLSYNGTWELQKPPKPNFIITPPASDIENLFQPPDLSGIDPSNPADDICGVFIAMLDWGVKLIEAGIQLGGDLIKMVTSPFTYLFRLGLYDLAMMIWDLVTKTHEIMAHTGFFIPHAQQFYPGGELRLPNEIDMPVITLGGTVDEAFRQALGDAFDPLGNLDRQPDVIGNGHSVSDERYPYYPVLRYHVKQSPVTWESWEFRRPWAYPDQSRATNDDGKHDLLTPTPTETYNPYLSFGEEPNVPYKPLRPGPYPAGTRPDVFFRLDAPVNRRVRSDYESAQTPRETDALNEEHLKPDTLRVSPLGDPIPFSVHLISQIANLTGYATQFNLDSDRAFAYLTWDWIRRNIDDPGGKGTGILNLTYAVPKEPPENDPVNRWARGKNPLLLKYVDPPPGPAAPPPPPIQ